MTLTFTTLSTPPPSRARAETGVVTPNPNYVTRTEHAGAAARVAVPHEPGTSIFTPRGPRFVDYTACPMCTAPRLGLKYQGELRDGTKVHELAPHSVGLNCSRNGQPRCMASDMRMTFVGGGWQGAQP